MLSWKLKEAKLIIHVWIGKEEKLTCHFIVGMTIFILETQEKWPKCYYARLSKLRGEKRIAIDSCKE